MNQVSNNNEVKNIVYKSNQIEDFLKIFSSSLRETPGSSGSLIARFQFFCLENA